jgi:hypothetical protein
MVASDNETERMSLSKDNRQAVRGSITRSSRVKKQRLHTLS